MARNLCGLAGVFVVLGLAIGVSIPIWTRLFHTDPLYILIVATAILGIGAVLAVLGCGVMIVDSREKSNDNQ